MFLHLATVLTSLRGLLKGQMKVCELRMAL